jgi:hypothetical protein
VWGRIANAKSLGWVIYANWAAHAGGPRAQQAGKLETWALFAGSQGGTVARAGRNTYAPLSARLDLKAPAVPRSDTDHIGPSSGRIDWHRCQWQGREGFRAQPVQELTEAVRGLTGRLTSGQGWPWIPTTPIDTREEKD